MFDILRVGSVCVSKSEASVWILKIDVGMERVISKARIKVMLHEYLFRVCLAVVFLFVNVDCDVTCGPVNPENGWVGQSRCHTFAGF